MRASAFTKEPWFPILLSAILPGLGQIYTGNYVRGLVMMGVIIGATYCNLFTDIWIPPPLYLPIWIWSLADAFKRYDFQLTMVTTQGQQNVACQKDAGRMNAYADIFSNREAWFPIALSTIIPGLGQIYTKTYDRGIIMIGIFVYSMYLERTSGFVEPFIVFMSVDIWSFYDAFMRCKRLIGEPTCSN